MTDNISTKFKQERIITSAQARDNLLDIVNLAHYTQACTLITKHHKPAAVVVPISELDRLRETKPGNEQTMTIDSMRLKFADVLIRTDYLRERTILTRRGRPIASIIPAEDFALLEQQPEQIEAQPGQSKFTAKDSQPS